MASIPAQRVYDDFVNFVAERVAAEEILAFRASPASQKRASRLMERLKNDEITPDEQAELEQMAQVDLLVSRLKARAAADLKRK